jgi:hypothetical protein
MVVQYFDKGDTFTQFKHRYALTVGGPAGKAADKVAVYLTDLSRPESVARQLVVMPNHRPGYTVEQNAILAAIDRLNRRHDGMRSHQVWMT